MRSGLDMLQNVAQKHGCYNARPDPLCPVPNTWLLPARPDTPTWLTGAHETIAVRIPDHPVARALCTAWSGYGGGALVSTSAKHRRAAAGAERA